MSRPRDDDELVERARRGDPDAYASLVREYQEIAFRTAYLITHDAADAEDAAQDGFVKAWRALPRFRRGAPVRPWLLQIVANEARNRRRSGGRREALAARAAHELSLQGQASAPEDSSLAAEERRALLRALEGLREEERLVLACRFLLGLSEAETAQALSLRPGTVKSRASRGLDRLRELMEAAYA